MTHLNIQQGSNVEIVSALIIKKLYDTALTVSEPLEGELDNAYLSGNLLVGRASQNKVKYLAGTVLVRGAGNEYNNPTGRFLDLKINVTDEYYIDFADSEVEEVLISGGFSSDGSGITISDAGSANIGTLFKDNTTITSFPEFKYFTLANTVSATNGMFNNCTNLTTIDLSLCTTMRYQLFANSGIQTVNAPILSSIGELVFNHCTNLTTVSNLGYITSIPSKTFQNCTSLTSVNLPLECTSIGQSAFLGCSSLTGGIDFTNVTSIGSNAFNECSNFNIGTELRMPLLTSIGSNAFRNSLPQLTTISSLGNITTLENDTFANCSNLTSVTLPNTLRTMYGLAFAGTSVSKLIYPEGVENAYYSTNYLYPWRTLQYIEIPSTCVNMGLFLHRAFEYSNAPTGIVMVIKATTPPTLGYTENQIYKTNDGVRQFSAIYVPNLQTYQNATGGWQLSSVLEKLKSIEDLLTDNPTMWAEYQSRITT